MSSGSSDQLLLLNLPVYDRLPEIWGEDAQSWNPYRWMNMSREKQINVGVYGNLCVDLVSVLCMVRADVLPQAHFQCVYTRVLPCPSLTLIQAVA